MSDSVYNRYMANKKPERMTDRIDVKCKPSQKKGWEDKAAKNGLYLPEWIRKVLDRSK